MEVELISVRQYSRNVVSDADHPVCYWNGHTWTLAAQYRSTASIDGCHCVEQSPAL